MSYILNIDTAVVSASICLAKDDEVLKLNINPSQKDHASWLHVAIKEMMEEAGISLQELDAIAVSSGPGSYTGLRVSMATAKGLCYALQKPLITVGTLKMMAVAAMDTTTELLCPMIDARRMEVFTAVYDHSLSEILSPVNIILEKESFKNLLEKHSILFFGNGSDKFKALISHPNASFKSLEATAQHMTGLSYSQFKNKDFADLAYTEPYYGKAFYTTFVKAS
ncbi:MAG TPA: tRNA (adenosine(37)-N6)-threonylcarbamoyltransferase complex dimerization subunit type 1 TsaB [Flavisolibacter sp.]|nr:tRNA (adenosine(37)-N6)-threonylcarbamoyltransferase complex dimerization subunit type 1 TsaB [Flavisolibacter sp.]